MSDAAGEAGHTVVVIHPGAMGDLVQALPAFAALRDRRPGSELVLAVGGGLAGLAMASGLVDRVIPIDSARIYRGSVAAKLGEAARLGRALRSARPDELLVLKAAPVYALLAAASGAPVRAGLTRGWGRFLLTDPVPAEPRLHREDRYLSAVQALEDGPVDWPRLNERVRRGLDEAWADVAPAADPGPGPVVALAPGGARNAKEEMAQRRWPAERYARLIRAIHEARPDARFVLLGAPSDRPEADAVLRAAAGLDVSDRVGETSLAEARALIGGSTLFVTHDSGLLHLAATTEVPVVAVFGPTDPRVAAPRRDRLEYLWDPAYATPCHDELTGETRPCADRCCMERVSVDSVLALCLTVLEAAAGTTEEA